MGDYNVNTLNEMLGSATHVHNFTNILLSHYFHKLIYLPTRERNESSTLLDNIYTNIPDSYNTCTSGVLKFLTQSDHYPIFTIRTNIELPKPKTHILKRDRSYKNIALFKRNINNINWNELSEVTNIVPAFTIFWNTIVAIFEKCFPDLKNK